MPSELTLRDIFAALAMHGILAADLDFTWSCKDAAEVAYRQADEMLKEREKDAL